ncbi:secretory calcium-binding phosphoprotein 9 [Oryzias melastigma]|uniref:secretory calcium-binding phosphoprotein 9 n=1 Tax=Oryzias melastigma TaxID=30732 RepID=UPI000CF82D34|nr:secretory calcium-binding phosphoprotein 9 [Oryzias melastigma]
MKFLLFVAFVATISYVNAGKTARLLAAMNAGMLNGMMAGGLNPPLVAGGGVGFIGQPQFAQFVPGLPTFALRAPVPNMFPAAVNAVPFMGVPQMAQMPQMAPMNQMGQIPQMAPMNQMGQMAQMAQMGQMAQMNPAQQPQMGMVGGAAQQQQLPLQADPLRRFRRQTFKPQNTLRSTVDNQIEVPTESTATAPPCVEEKHAMN